MDVSFHGGTPIYLQIVERFKTDIARGRYEPGQRVCPVRELALMWGVNPNTMQRALSELERDGLLYSERTAGRYVTGDAGIIRTLRQSTALKTAMDYARAMRALNFTEEDVVTLTKEALRREEKHS